MICEVCQSIIARVPYSCADCGYPSGIKEGWSRCQFCGSDKKKNEDWAKSAEDGARPHEFRRTAEALVTRCCKCSQELSSDRAASSYMHEWFALERVDSASLSGIAAAEVEPWFRFTTVICDDCVHQTAAEHQDYLREFCRRLSEIEKNEDTEALAMAKFLSMIFLPSALVLALVLFAGPGWGLSKDVLKWVGGISFVATFGSGALALFAALSVPLKRMARRTKRYGSLRDRWFESPAGELGVMWHTLKETLFLSHRRLVRQLVTEGGLSCELLDDEGAINVYAAYFIKPGAPRLRPLVSGTAVISHRDASERSFVSTQFKANLNPGESFEYVQLSGGDERLPDETYELNVWTE